MNQLRWDTFRYFLGIRLDLIRSRFPLYPTLQFYRDSSVPSITLISSSVIHIIWDMGEKYVDVFMHEAVRCRGLSDYQFPDYVIHSF